MTELVNGNATSGGWRALIGAFRQAAARIARSIAIRRGQRMLHALPDELLKDIGISRSDIEYLAEALVDGRQDPTRRPRS